MAKTLIIIPTYNEEENIARLIDEIYGLNIDLDILVIEDGADKTEQIVKDKQSQYPNLYLIKREKKSGRGTAVLEGFKFGLERNYDYFVEMDADFSHQPTELPNLLKLAGPNRVVIASRYVAGSKIENWPIKRKIISRLANIYANFILGIGIHDYTNGYRVYGRQAVQKLDFEKIKSAGYIVLSEIAYQLYKKDVDFAENSTVFVNRSRGKSNMSFNEIKESLLAVLRIKKDYR